MNTLNLKQYPFDKNGEKEVYGKIVINNVVSNNERHKSDKLSFQISILNRQMIDYDYENLVGEYNENYKPYFYEFFAVSRKNTLNHFIYENQDKWLKMYFTTEKNLKEIGHILGNVIFAVSAIEIKRGALVITDEDAPDEVVDKILSSYDTTKDVTNDKLLVKKALDSVIPTTINSMEVATFNVGQGHCSYIIMNKNNRILYDIGFTRFNRSSTLNINKNKIIFKSIQANAVVLSHWDLDHILGAVYMNDDIYKHNTLWVAPDLNSPKVKAYASSSRLCKYLSWNPNVELIMINDSLNNNQIYPDKLGNFNIWKGKGNKDTLNEANNYGLILELRLKSNMLLAGDCEYSQMSDNVVNRFFQFNHFVIPHHCSKISIPVLIKGAFAKAKLLGLPKPKSAIISVGFNTYRHPDVNHIKDVERLGYKCLYTNKTDFHLIDLSVL
jgi:beta-lactamase superfamily II metal-dependent hydrolase